jgi:Lytic transglycolase
LIRRVLPTQAGLTLGCALVLGVSCAPSHSSARITRTATPRASGHETSTPTPPAPALPAPEADWRAAYRNRRAIREIEGDCSYYSDALAGRSTASGEPYDPSAYTAAHRELRFGTVLRVTRIDTGASTIVRVNDRGPFGRRPSGVRPLEGRSRRALTPSPRSRQDACRGAGISRT